MRMLTLPLACFLALGASQARAQVSIHLDLHLPIAPRLVVVEPGIQVVEAFDEEVFFHHGWYWCRRPDGWYRARSPRARFEWVEAHRVPPGLVRMPAGHYRNWHRGDMRHDGHRDFERREEHRERKEERRERKEERRERHEDRRGEGRHHGH